MTFECSAAPDDGAEYYMARSSPEIDEVARRIKPISMASD